MTSKRDVEPAVFSLAQASQYLRINVPELRKMLQMGEPDCFRTPGGHWRVPRRACDAYVDREVEFERRMSR